MKKTRCCPKCSSRRIGHIPAQPDTEDFVDGPQGPAEIGTVPTRAVGQGAVLDTGFLAYGDVTLLVGTLEAFVCADCGLYESYVVKPSELRWESITNFSWINPEEEDGSPYR